MWILPSGLRTKSTKVGGKLECTWCDSTSLKEVDRYPPDRVVYRCKKCNMPMTYCSTPMSLDGIDRLKRPNEHPYAHMKYGPSAPRNIAPGGIIKIPGLGSYKVKKKTNPKIH